MVGTNTKKADDPRRYRDHPVLPALCLVDLPDLAGRESTSRINFLRYGTYIEHNSRNFALMTSRSDNNRPLKDWLKVFSQSPQIRSKLYQTRVEKMWQEVMGPVIHQYTRRIRLDGQILIIYVESAPLKAELAIMRDTIRQSVNERLGEDFVKEVRIL